MPLQPAPGRTTFSYTYDPKAAWVAPDNALTNQASQTLASTSTPKAPLFLASPSNWITTDAPVTDQQIVLYAKGAHGTEMAEICWSEDSGLTCASDAFDTAALGTRVSVCATCQLPSGFPNSQFASWGIWRTGTGAYDLGNQSYRGVSISGHVITAPTRAGTPWGFNTDRVSGTVVTLTGCATGFVDNPLTIAHVDSPTQIMVTQTFTATGCTFQEYASGIRVILKNAGTLSFSATYNSVRAFAVGGGESGSRDVCNPAPITDIVVDCDGMEHHPQLTGRLCAVFEGGSNGIYLVQDNGRMCLQSIGHHETIQHLYSVGNPWIGPKAWIGSDGRDLWSVSKRTADRNYTEYVPGAGSSVQEDRWQYVNLTATGIPLNTQIANGPASDAKSALATALFGNPDFGHVGIFGGHIQLSYQPGGDASPCFRGITDSKYRLIQTYTSWTRYPITWGGCHSNASFGSSEYTNLVFTPLMNFNRNKLLGGPFALPLTAIRKRGVFKTYSIPISAGTPGNPTRFISVKHDLAFYSTMSTGGGPYITCSGGTGAWSAVNVTFHAGIQDNNSFTVPVSTSGAYPGGITCVTSPQATLVNIGAVKSNLITIASDAYGYGSYVRDERSLFEDGDPIAISSHPIKQYYAKATGAPTNKQFYVYDDPALTVPSHDVFTTQDNVGLAESCPTTGAAALMPNGKIYYDTGSLRDKAPLIRCLTLRVRSEPCSEWPASGEAQKYRCPTNNSYSSLQNIAAGDVIYDITGADQPNHEHFLVLTKTVNSPVSIDLTVMRRYGAAPYSASWGSDAGVPYCCGVHSMGWFPVAYVNMKSAWFQITDPTATPLPESPIYAGSHHDVGPGGGPGLVTLAAGLTGFNDINGKTMADMLASPVVSDHNNVATWAGNVNDTMANGQKQSYPGHRQTLSGIEATWKSDVTAINIDYGNGANNVDGVFNRTVTKIASFHYVYQISNPAPSGTTNIKLVPYLLTSGVQQFVDISGPMDCRASAAGANCINDSTIGQYCIVYNAATNDCIDSATPGYSKGNVYFSTKIQPATGPGSCASNNNVLAVPCFYPLWPMAGWYEQIRQTPTDRDGTGVRRLTTGWTLPLSHFTFANWISSPDAKWGIYIPNPIAAKGAGGSAAFAMKLPPWPVSDETRRSTFVAVIRKFEGGRSRRIRIRFGYAENGDPMKFYCTTRREACWTSVGATPSNPFVFDGEVQPELRCDDGCTVAIPAIPGRILFYQALHSDGSRTVSEPLQAVAVR